MKIVANGWDLANYPCVVASHFALEWLNGLAESNPDFNLNLVVPQSASDVQVVDRIKTTAVNIGLSAWDQIQFEQRRLSDIALQWGANLVLYPTGGAPLRSSLPSVTFPRLPDGVKDRSFMGRLGWALRNAGRSGASAQLAVLEPGQDLKPQPGVVELPAWVSEAFNPLIQPSDQTILEKYSLDSGFVISFVSDRRCLARLLEVWQWVTDSMDADQPLVVAGLPLRENALAEDLIGRRGLNEAVKIVRGLSLQELPAIFRQAAGYYHACITPYGQELRWAMAAGVPVVGLETPVASQILRKAAYLASPDNVRGLAAACITILVETSVADELRQKGLTIARRYHQSSFMEILTEALRQAAGV